MKANDPPVEVNQVWSVKDEDGRTLRKIRILGEYPGGMEAWALQRIWIYEELPARFMNNYRIERCPEFNLRYVFTLEGMYDPSS